MSKTTDSVENKSRPTPGFYTSRRSFLHYSGAAFATGALLLSGCEMLEDYIPPKDNNDSPKMVNLGSGDIGILNYAYALEQLEAAFYTKVVLASLSYGATPEELRLFEDLRRHEVAHRDFFKAALGAKAIANLKFDFSSVDLGDKNQVLSTALAIENLGVAAYNGAGKLLETPDFLVVAGKIVSVEARHAAAVFDVINPDGAFIDFIEDGLDRAFMPSEVLQAAAPFIVTKIDASNLPTA